MRLSMKKIMCSSEWRRGAFEKTPRPLVLPNLQFGNLWILLYEISQFRGACLLHFCCSGEILGQTSFFSTNHSSETAKFNKNFIIPKKITF
jgi:hypothetical protein